MEPQVPMPPRLVDLKKQLIPENSKELTKAWEELLATLAEETALFKREGSNASAISQGGYLKAKLNQSELQIIPQVDFSELTQLTEEDKARIKRRGCVVIRNVVDDAEALQWKQDLVEFVRANPDVEGMEVVLTPHVDISHPYHNIRFPERRQAIFPTIVSSSSRFRQETLERNFLVGRDPKSEHVRTPTSLRAGYGSISSTTLVETRTSKVSNSLHLLRTPTGSVFVNQVGFGTTSHHTLMVCSAL